MNLENYKRTINGKGDKQLRNFAMLSEINNLVIGHQYLEKKSSLKSTLPNRGKMVLNVLNSNDGSINIFSRREI